MNINPHTQKQTFYLRRCIALFNVHLSLKYRKHIYLLYFSKIHFQVNEVQGRQVKENLCVVKQIFLDCILYFHLFIYVWSVCFKGKIIKFKNKSTKLPDNLQYNTYTISASGYQSSI